MKAVISEVFDAPVSKVWDALTKPELIKQYLFDTNTESTWEVGTPVFFRGEWEGQTYEEKGTILENEYQKKLTYTYLSSMGGKEDKPENYSIVSNELEDLGGKTKLTITQDNIQDEQTKEHSAANWKMVLEKMKTVVGQ